MKPDLCTREISAKQRRRAFHYYFFECTFKGYYTAKNGDVLLSTPLICTVLFIWESPRVLKITVQGHSIGSVNIANIHLVHQYSLCLQQIIGKAGIHVKAVLTLLNTAFLAISQSCLKQCQVSLLISLTTVW